MTSRPEAPLRSLVTLRLVNSHLCKLQPHAGLSGNFLCKRECFSFQEVRGHWHGHYRAYCYLPLYVFSGRHLLAAVL